MSQGKEMRTALKKYVIPFLRENKFKGSYPHLRRVVDNNLELITFQFMRGGGSFTVNLGKCPLDNIIDYKGNKMELNEVTAYDRIRNGYQTRMSPNKEKVDHWFIFDCGIAYPQKIKKKINDSFYYNGFSSIYYGKEEDKYIRISEYVINMFETVGFTWFKEIE